MLKVRRNVIWRDDGVRLCYVRPEAFVTESPGYGLPIANTAHVGPQFKYDESISGGNFIGNTLGGEDIAVGGGANTGEVLEGEDLTYQVGRAQSIRNSLWDAPL